MQKTSLYLNDRDLERLKRLAAREGGPQAQIVGQALAVYEASLIPDRNFALAGSWNGDGSSVADVSEADLLKRSGR
jgi:hypothetical protein